MEPGATLSTLLLLTLLLLVLLVARRGGSGPRLPPGPWPLPIVGNLLQISPSRTLQSLLKLSQTYGPVFTVHLGTRPVVVLRGAATVRQALVDNAEAFAGRGRMPTVEETFHGHGVVFADGERWRQLRRFSLTVLRDFGMGRRSIESRICQEAQMLLQELRDTKEQPFDPYLLSSAVSNIICSIVFGDRFDYRDSEFLELLRLMNESFREISTPWSQLYEMGESFLRFLPGPHRRIPRLLGRMRDFIARRVRGNAASLGQGEPRDFIDCFLLQMDKEKDNPDTAFNQENLELTTLNLFFAGTETVSSTLRYGFLMLMKHPEVQEKMHKEIDRVIGWDRAPRIEDPGDLGGLLGTLGVS
ncbi:LOW QUALITY PROTEIN: cytochrome P450 2G1-like [Aegotheles albertisi]